METVNKSKVNEDSTQPPPPRGKGRPTGSGNLKNKENTTKPRSKSNTREKNVVINEIQSLFKNQTELLETQLTNLDFKLNSLEINLDKKIESISQYINERLNNNEHSITNNTQKIHKIEEKISNICDVMSDEVEERISRLSNIIIAGVPESDKFTVTNTGDQGKILNI